MKKHPLLVIGILAVLTAGLFLFSSCNGPNDPKGTVPDASIPSDSFPKPADGETYQGYTISWTDANGKQRTKTVTVPVSDNITLEGGLKPGSEVKIIPFSVENGKQIEHESQSISLETIAEQQIQSGMTSLENQKWDDALRQFKAAYQTKPNNTTKTYYALTKLASISVKPETVTFMKNRMGFEAYPNSLDALVNLEWFEDYQQNMGTNLDGQSHTITIKVPKIKKADWYKKMHPLLHIPAYLVEHSAEANIDTLVDELYDILFGAEYHEAKDLLNSLDTAPIPVDKRLLKLIALDQVLGEDTELSLHKDQLLGIIGGYTLVKGAFEFIQSYSFNTDLSILKFNWEKIDFDKGLAQNINGYDKKLDPFNNGFLTGRSKTKLEDSKRSFIEGLDSLIKLYDSLITDGNMPADAQKEVKKMAFVKTILVEVRDAIKEGRKANLLIGEDNMLTEGFAAFELNMGNIFTYEHFKLSTFFEMNGNKPKVFPAANGEPAYLKMNYKTFIDSFMKVHFLAQTGHDEINNTPIMEEVDISEEVWDGKIPLVGQLGEKIKAFYE